ncbi:MAG: tol-pal system-associated acyl-CoA thioesterase [Proteobacteria bacterium]|nr:tol-pal system-associated acyl-CoA thioesterase [Pseudomonadota bacterium]
MSASVHQHPFRVYYEDTDASGVVYHAAYVCFFERGRSEWLRQLGVCHHDVAASSEVVFAVKTLMINYQRSAVLDDWLVVHTTAEQSGRSRLLFKQELWRNDRLLADARIEVVCVRGDPFRAVAIPQSLIALLPSPH